MPVRRPRVCLKLLELERRDVPAWWSVSVPTPAEGEAGVTDAAHWGELLAHLDELPDGNDGVLVEADTREAAVALAAAGTVTAELAGETAEYTFGPDTVGLSTSDEKPFLVAVDGDQATVYLEDLVGFPDAIPDWDYDDRS